jgi:hypothetical protein
MPTASTCFLYGLLSEENISGLDCLSLVGRSQTIKGFIFVDWMKE